MLPPQPDKAVSVTTKRNGVSVAPSNATTQLFFLLFVTVTRLSPRLPQPDEAVSVASKRNGVSVRSYKIIYELIDDVKAAMEGKLKLVEERVPQVGHVY